MVTVELVYPGKGCLFHMTLDLEEGSTILDALNQSKIYLLHPETKDLKAGIFSKLLPLDTLLKTGDRVEIYRPLTTDPKDKRRLRAKKSY